MVQKLKAARAKLKAATQAANEAEAERKLCQRECDTATAQYAAYWP